VGTSAGAHQRILATTRRTVFTPTFTDTNALVMVKD
jgi:hypothetical protein